MTRGINHAANSGPFPKHCVHVIPHESVQIRTDRERNAKRLALSRTASGLAGLAASLPASGGEQMRRPQLQQRGLCATGATRAGCDGASSAGRMNEPLRRYGGAGTTNTSKMWPLVLCASRIVLPSIATSKLGSLLFTFRFGERRLKAACSTRSTSSELNGLCRNAQAPLSSACVSFVEVLLGRDHDDLQRRPDQPQLLHRVQPAQARHVAIEERHVELRRSGKDPRRFRRRRLR